jgi:hypothetical protein
MKRVILSVLLAAGAYAAPAAAGPEVVRCGITPRIPCGVCYYDEASATRTCVSPELVGS